MESYNAILIEQGKEMPERLQLLRDLAVRQMETISGLSIDKLPMIENESSE